MKLVRKLSTWIETRGAVPAYGGWVLLGLVICFWMAAANTMAGWLYVLSGLGIALLLISAMLPMRMLRCIEVTRSPLYSVQAGESLSITLTLLNRTVHSKGPLIVQDQGPSDLGQFRAAVDVLAPQASYTWRYCVEPQHRGLYQWRSVMLQTGAPLGLFWSQRLHAMPATVLIYPKILPLQRCPLLDDVGPSLRQLQQQVPISQQGQEGATRSLRPYRTGDPVRLIHWRSSARFSELRIRELERMGGSQILSIGLDVNQSWHPDQFEQAVIAAASLYSYALQRYGSALLWTASTGNLQDKVAVLETLAQIQPQIVSTSRPDHPLIWLTARPESLGQLSPGSRYILWPQEKSTLDYAGLQSISGLTVNLEQPLQTQLQRPF